MNQSAQKRLAGKLGLELAPFAARQEERGLHQVFELGPPPGADYAFSVWVSEDGEPQITARLIREPGEHYFWALRFETPAWAYPEARDVAFFEALGFVINCTTRIVQSKGLIFTSFMCSHQSQTVWTDLGGNSVLRWSSPDTPRISGRRREYFSPRLLRAA
jgi:hypothetical protein